MQTDFYYKKWWDTYSNDVVKRLLEFNNIRTDTFQVCFTGDSRTIDIYQEVKKRNSDLYKLLVNNGIGGRFTSPPYVGLIDYHEQHAYAYEIFRFERKDEFEIGALHKGCSRKERDSYVKDLAEVLLNCKKYLRKGFNIFLVANDKFNLYEKIPKLCGLTIVNQFKRPVLNRVEKDRETAYSESIFHMRER